MRARTKSIMDRLKNFACLDKTFRHSNDKHAACFRAAAVCVQLAMEGGEVLMDCSGYDDTLTDQEVIDLYGL